MGGLGLYSLEHRKLRVDLTGMYKVNAHSLCPRKGESISRENKFNVKGEIFKRDPRGNLRVTNEGQLFTQSTWNEQLVSMNELG